MAGGGENETGFGVGPHGELEEATIAGLQAQMEAGEVMARRLAEMYLERIEALDRGGPRLRSVIEVNPEALEIADALDRERRAGRVRGPLHGVPVLIKDNIATTDRMETTAGSLALLGARPPAEAFVAARLRAAGAVLLGKTNLSEWANFRSPRSSSGWSGRGGLCLNPYALDVTPSGSSSGSGVAIAANLAAGALGSETDGSILSPASANGVVGIKPTVGLTSRAGVIPISHSQDTVGPMTRTVADAALLLGAIAGADPDDPATHAAEAPADYTRFLDPDGLRGARIGVPREVYWGYSPPADAICEDALDALRKLGAEIVDPADIPTAREMTSGWPPSDDTTLTVLLYEFKADLNAYLGALGPEAPVRTLTDLIAFNETHAEREMPFFGQELLLMAEEKGPLTDPAYLAALERNYRLSRREGIDAVMEQFHLDALVMPTTNPAAKTDLVNGGRSAGSSSRPAALAGYPAITVPAGQAFGLPVGITFMGRAFSEPTLIKLAYAFEQSTQARRPPRYAPPGVLPPDPPLGGSNG
ncbi:MAG: amidase [Chloroflexota bacterium]|nr:amidase [Chloroflexota bacterium]